MSQTKKLFTVIFLLVGVSLLFSSRIQQESAKELFEKAIYLEETKGELEKAIAVYDRIIKEFPDERAIAAKAQLHIGTCFEKLGIKEAQKAYQNVIDKYPEQTESVKIAKEKLSILLKARAVVKKGDVEQKATKIFESTEKAYGFISPDGTNLALVGGEGDIWLREISSGKETRLTQTPSFKYWCFWSPDSKTIAYLDVLNGLFVVPKRGGEPRALIKSDSDFIKEGNYAWPTGWTSDSQMILCQIPKRGLCAIPISGEEWKDIFKYPDQKTENDYTLLTLSPNGKFLAYESKKDIYIMPADGGKSIQITNHPASDSWPVWSFDGKWISFFSSRSGDAEIWVIKISPNGYPEGDPIQVFRGLSIMNTSYNWVKDGTIGISLNTSVSNIFIRDLETGEETQLTNILTYDRNPRWSPNGDKIAFISPREGKFDLWMISSQGGEAKKLTINVPNPNGYRYITKPSWLPDGKKLVFGGFFGYGNRGIWVVPTEGGVPQKIKFDFDPWIEYCDVSPDGANIAFDYVGADEGNPIVGSRTFEKDIYVIPFEGGKPQRVTKIDKSGLSFHSPRWSPDGKKITFRSMNWFEDNEGKESNEIWVSEFPDGDCKPITKKMKGMPTHLSWSRDGKTIIFSMFEKNKNQIYTVPSDGGEITKMNIEGYSPDFSPNDKRIAYGKGHLNRIEYWLVENFLPIEKKD